MNLKSEVILLLSPTKMVLSLYEIRLYLLILNLQTFSNLRKVRLDLLVLTRLLMILIKILIKLLKVSLILLINHLLRFTNLDMRHKCSLCNATNRLEIELLLFLQNLCWIVTHRSSRQLGKMVADMAPRLIAHRIGFRVD